MKKVRLFLIMGVTVLLGFTACEESENLSVESLEGIYEGTLTSDNSLKSTANFSGEIQKATAEVTDLGDGQIEVHCYSETMDTTFVLNHYEHNDSVMVCLNGEAFEEMYGHMMGHGGNMGNGNSGGMMGGMNNGSSEWMNHMNNEHEEGDEHFGGFNMSNRTFGYTIKSEDGDYHFQGTKIEMDI